MKRVGVLLFEVSEDGVLYQQPTGGEYRQWNRVQKEETRDNNVASNVSLPIGRVFACSLEAAQLSSIFKFLAMASSLVTKRKIDFSSLLVS